MTESYIPYAKHTIEDDDIAAVADALRSPFLSSGPKVAEFERALAEYCSASDCVAFANGTLALLAAYEVAGIAAGKPFITTPLTFPATVNAGLWLGAEPVYADVDQNTGNILPSAVDSLVSPATSAIVAVDFAGLPAHYDEICAIARRRDIFVIADAAHSLGASYGNRPVGSLADLTVLSFHPVKTITTGEGGAVLTNRRDLAERLKLFRNQGMQKTEDYYQISSRALNARLTDIQSALGLSQLRKADRFIERRRSLVARYLHLLRGTEDLLLPIEPPGSRSAWHLFVVRLRNGNSKLRWSLVRRLREAGIGVQVHYPVVYDHSYFKYSGRRASMACPNAEGFAATCISLPLFPSLTENEQDRVVGELLRCLKSSVNVTNSVVQG